MVKGLKNVNMSNEIIIWPNKKVNCDNSINNYLNRIRYLVLILISQK